MIIVIAYKDDGSDSLFGPFESQIEAEAFIDSTPVELYVDMQIRYLTDGKEN